MTTNAERLRYYLGYLLRLRAMERRMGIPFPSPYTRALVRQMWPHRHDQ